MRVLDENIFDFSKFRLDNTNKILRYNGEIVSLPLKSVELLCLLVENRGEVVNKQEIFERVWHDSFVEDSVLTQNIYQLRKMFEEYGEKDLIKTVPRRGYIFTFENETSHIIEREIYEEIEIIETETLPEKQVLALPSTQNNSKFKVFGIGIVALFLITSAVFGYWFWNGKVNKTTVSEINSLAVLPLKSFDEKAVDDNLRLRMMDSLITKLGKIETISVRPTSSTMKFLKSDESSLEIGKKLLVDAILEGSIQREENKLRITLQLVSTKNGEQIWSEQFDGEADKLLDLQNAVSAKLLDTLNLPLSNEQQTEFAKRPTTNSEAYEEYLKGRYFWNKRTPESLKSAIISFEKAIKLDSNFADAFVGLADSHYLLFDYSYDTSQKNVELAQFNIHTAIEINPKLSEAFTTLGSIQTTIEWNWKPAEKSFQKAIEFSPNSPNAHHRYGMLLMKLRRFTEAENEMRKAKELDPTSPAINKNLGVLFFFEKRCDEAIIHLNKSLDLDNNFVGPRWYLARCNWLNNQKKETLLEYAKAIEIEGNKDLAAKIINDANSFNPKIGVKNLLDEWQKQVNSPNVSFTDLAILSSYLEDKNATLNWLEKAVAARHPWATWINAEVEFDFVREEPRFKALLEKMNLNER
jgi:DNA-binding winged helix-turn-helix (wHTH) protein/TolB-like protein/Tfp pilus assembly protein PilF